MKHCCQCGQDKDDSEFNRDRSHHTGLQHYCRECSKERRKTYYPKAYDTKLRSKYGISLSEYREMFCMQASGCAICGEWPNSEPLCVDHNHETGEVRGLLCRRCNSGIGFFYDYPTLLLRSFDYLERE